MMFCVECGKALANDARFCTGCGTKAVRESSSEALSAQSVSMAAPNPGAGMASAITSAGTRNLSGKDIVKWTAGVVAISAVGAIGLSILNDHSAGGTLSTPAMKNIRPLAFLVTWIGVAIFAKRRKLSSVVAAGVGLLAAGIVFTGVSVVGSSLEGIASYGAANQIIQQSLVSPSSFSVISEGEVWAGKDSAGKDAHIVRVEYDAANGFGAVIRGCKLVAYTLVGDHFSWNPLVAMMDCGPFATDKPVPGEVLEAIRKYNFEK